MNVGIVQVAVGVAPFVWHAGKCWAVPHSTLDHRGHLSLVSLRDSSLGVSADPVDCHNCDAKTIDAIRYFLEKDRQ